MRFLHYHAVVEQAISSSGMAFTHLRPNLYMQGMLAFRYSIQSDGRIDSERSHEGKIYDVTGPEALTHAEKASRLTDALGKQIMYVDIPETAMPSTLLSFGFPEWQADGLIEDYAHYRRGEASGISPAVQDVTGHPPGTFREFATDYKETFLH